MHCIGMQVHAINRHGRTDERVDWIGTPERLNEFLEAADVLLISAPLTRATYGLIGAAELRRMKNDAILVNVARGEIVQERPLYDHLVRHPRVNRRSKIARRMTGYVHRPESAQEFEGWIKGKCRRKLIFDVWIAPPVFASGPLAAQLGTAAFGFGGKAASLVAPRRRSSAILSALSSFSSGGT